MCGRYVLDPEDNREISEIIEQVNERVKTGEILRTNTIHVLMEEG